MTIRTASVQSNERRVEDQTRRAQHATLGQNHHADRGVTCYRGDLQRCEQGPGDSIRAKTLNHRIRDLASPNNSLAITARRHNISASDRCKYDDDRQSKRHRNVTDDRERWRADQWNANALLHGTDYIKGPCSRQCRHGRIVLLATRRDLQNSKRSCDDLR